MRFRILPIAALAVFPFALLAHAQTPAPLTTQTADARPPTSFTVGDPGRQFNADSARGQLLAIHFLLPTDCPYCIRTIKEYVQNAPTLAGVRQIYVNAHAVDGFAEWLKTVPNADTLPIYRDQDAQLAKQFRIPGDYKFHNAVMTYPAIVLLDAEGREIYRYVCKSNTDRVPFATFAAKVAELTRDKETTNANTSDAIALQGYDPVAYLDEAKASVGSKEIASSFRGLNYRFATAENRDKFDATPQKYLPAYGGWCATAMAEGKKVEVDPKNFKVVSGRLFLFYKGIFGNAINDWNKDEPGLTTKADASWNKLVATK